MTWFNLGELSNNHNYKYNPFRSTHHPYQPATVTGIISSNHNPADVYRFRITPKAFSPNLISIYSDLQVDERVALSLWQDKTMNESLDVGDQPLATGSISSRSNDLLSGLCIFQIQLCSTSDYLVVASTSSSEEVPYRLIISDIQLPAMWSHFLSV